MRRANTIAREPGGSPGSTVRWQRKVLRKGMQTTAAGSIVDARVELVALRNHVEACVNQLDLLVRLRLIELPTLFECNGKDLAARVVLCGGPLDDSFVQPELATGAVPLPKYRSVSASGARAQAHTKILFS